MNPKLSEIADCPACAESMQSQLPSPQCNAFKGSQRYSIPIGVNLKAYQSVIIWCERFGILISPTDLKTDVAAR